MATECDRVLAHDYMRRHNEVLRCIHLEICRKYGQTNNKKIGSHSVQEGIANNGVEIRVDTRISTRIEVKYNSQTYLFLKKGDSGGGDNRL